MLKSTLLEHLVGHSWVLDSHWKCFPGALATWVGFGRLGSFAPDKAPRCAPRQPIYARCDLSPPH